MLEYGFVPAWPTAYTFAGALPFPTSIGICQTPTVMSQMANSVALVAFRSTWTIMVIVAFRAQWLRSPYGVSPFGVDLLQPVKDDS
nr:hypothetical protein [Tanacetum cinerariifolium]